MTFGNVLTTVQKCYNYDMYGQNDFSLTFSKRKYRFAIVLNNFHTTPFNIHYSFWIIQAWLKCLAHLPLLKVHHVVE